MTDELTTATTTIALPLLGEVLLAARNAKKLSLIDVSNHLRLSIKQIEALENNNFAVLPQAMITRGFIRNYARLLEVDPEPLLESYRARMPEMPLGELRVQTAITQSTLNKKSQSWTKYAFSSLLILGSLTWFFYSEYKPNSVKQRIDTVADVASKNLVTEIASLPEIALPVAERDAGNTVASPELPTADNAQTIPNDKVVVAGTPPVANLAQSVKLRPSTDVDFDMLKEHPTQPAQTQLGTASETNARDMSKTNDTIEASKNLRLSVSEEVWVQATDKSGAVIYEKILAANTQDSIDGQPPFNLIIGNAKATKLTFFGKTVDLSENTKNNVAHVTLE